MVAQQGAFDEAADGVLFVGVELVEGFEVVGQIVGDAPFPFVEYEHICADVERQRHLAKHVEGGLAGAGFVAA